MKSGRRKVVQPLNFTPDEAKLRPLVEDRPRTQSKPAPAAQPAASPPLTDDVFVNGGLGPRRSAPDLGVARHAYLFATLAALAWAGMLLAYTVGYVGGIAGLMRAPMQLAVVTLMAVLPGVFIFAGAFAVRQGARLAAELRWSRSLSEDLLTPAALAAARTGDVVSAVRQEVERAAAVAVSVHGQLISVREALAGESDRLVETAAEAQRTTRVVGETLARERGEVCGVLASLQAQTADIEAAVERQSRLVGEASDLARTQLGEAEATLVAGAARLADASAEAGANARDAGDMLVRQSERLDAAAAALSERLRFLEARLSEQRAGLIELAQGLDTGQDDMAARLESHRAQLLDVIAQAQAGAAEIGVASSDGARALQALVSAGADQVRELTDTVREHQAAIRTEAAEARQEAQNELHRTLDALARLGEDARRTLAAEAEQVQATAGTRVSAARAEVEQLGELAFAAGQRADQAFQARIGEARRMIENVAGLVEDAGVRSAARIDTGLEASRAALGELSGALGDFEGQLARMPDAARRQTEVVRLAVERGLDDLTAAARRAAEETQLIDATFQDRIRRNYETLSEAVRLMGRVAGTTDSGREAAQPPSLSPARVPPQASAALAPAQAADLLNAFGQPPPASARAQEPPPRPMERRAAFAARAPTPPPAPVFGRASRDALQPAPEPGELLLEAAAVDPPGAEPAPPREEPVLRPRLKLTPTESDKALKAVFAATPAPPPEGATGAPDAQGRSEWDADLDEWTWKDLLTSMDDAPTDTDALADQLIREIEQLGVDAAALLPRVRVDEVVAALTAGDSAAARDSVRRLAPAAIRRLSRRVLTDKGLREQTDRFVERYRTLVRDVDVDDREAVAAVLGTEAGRAYLLLEAAVGEL